MFRRLLSGLVFSLSIAACVSLIAEHFWAKAKFYLSESSQPADDGKKIGEGGGSEQPSKFTHDCLDQLSACL